MTHNVASILALAARLPGAPFVLYFKERKGGLEWSF